MNWLMQILPAMQLVVKGCQKAVKNQGVSEERKHYHNLKWPKAGLLVVGVQSETTAWNARFKKQ